MKTKSRVKKVLGLVLSLGLLNMGNPASYWLLSGRSQSRTSDAIGLFARGPLAAASALLGALLNPPDASAQTFEIMNKLLVDGSSTFKGAALFVSTSQPTSYSGTGTLYYTTANGFEALTEGSATPAPLTLQGNTFNGNSELVQLNGSGQLPALSGTNLSNLNWSQLTGGLPVNCASGYVSGIGSGGTLTCGTPAGTGVTSVTASAPLASSGGTTPNISLTGTVGAANGGTGTGAPGGSNEVPYYNGSAYSWSNTPTLLSLTLSNSGANAFVVNSSTLVVTNGDVGIGTASPGEPLDVNGIARASGEIIGTMASGSGQFRAISGNYGAFLRNDGSNTYFLLTNSGDQYGSWNSLRPFAFNDGSGAVTMGNGASVSNGLSADTLSLASEPVYPPFNLTDTGGSAQWVKLGTLTIGQDGKSAFITVVTNSGYNATSTQNTEVHLRFKTSNASSVDGNGFCADSSYYATGENAQFLTTGSIKWVANASGCSATAYSLYVDFGAYTGSSFYNVETSAGSWVNSDATGQSDPGAASATVEWPANVFEVQGNATVAGTTFFGTGSTYEVTNAGAGTLAGSKAPSWTSPNSSLLFGNSGGAGSGADEYVFYHGAVGGTRLASIVNNGSNVGDIKAAAFTTTGTPDLSEYIQARPEVEAGDVVVADPREMSVPGPGGERVRVMRADEPYQSGLLGVISDGSSSFEIESHVMSLDKSYPGKPLVLAGRVPVKVDLEGGPIKIGDYLTSSSRPGYAMRAAGPGPTVGIALENFDGAVGATGKILCFVHVGEDASLYKERLDQEQSEINEQNGVISDLRRQLNHLEERLGDGK